MMNGDGEHAGALGAGESPSEKSARGSAACSHEGKSMAARTPIPPRRMHSSQNKPPLPTPGPAPLAHTPYQGIDSKMAELGSFWSGDAATSYNTLMANWQEKANKLNNILNDLRDNLRGTAKDQAANEEDNQSRTSRLQSLLS